MEHALDRLGGILGRIDGFLQPLIDVAPLDDLDRLDTVTEQPTDGGARQRIGFVFEGGNPVEVLAERTGRRDTRPLLRDGDRAATLARLDEERRPNYAEADIHVRSGQGAHGDVVDAIIAALRERFTVAGL